ncbi:hypothetical protein ON010_g5329 [Phytophthora cinnamomi]|nr:hypothetical protein ON010_g5329 [Phytophthora cinnamomi]
MRSAKIAWIVGSMILLLAGCTLSEPTKYGQGGTGTMAAFDAPQNSRVRAKTSLRTLRETTNTRDEELGEEERMSLPWVKKLNLGKSTPKDVDLKSVYKKIEAQHWKDLRKIAVNNEKARKVAEEAAQKAAIRAKNAQMFDDILEDSTKRQYMIEQWYEKSVALSKVKKLMQESGKTNEQIEVIVNAIKAHKKDMRMNV